MREAIEQVIEQQIDGNISMKECLDRIMEIIETNGLDFDDLDDLED